MKFTLSAVVLALAASQAAAVVPIPVPECTHSYVVEPGTPHCEAFATKFGVTFADLLKWNQKLRPDCANLDVGYPICVSVTKGDCCLKENPKGALIPQPGVPPQGNLWDPAPYTKGPATTPTTSSGVVTPPVTTGTVPPVNGTATTAPPTSAPTVPPTRSTTSVGTNPTPQVPSGGKNAASSSKASMALAAAGVVLSVAYML
ncbi:MAG: hypothetical protein JOS17DRAFT_727419 [Linnemannia elongata]|nr:MAG: hypothetical protein JOS17DRAFT_727419 [Linnemannia elongata]